MIEAGNLGLRLSPIATGFWDEAKAKLKSGNAPKAEIKVEANIRKASEEIALFRMREQANAINLKVKIDESSIRTASEKIRYIEHTWKQSDIKRAIRVNVYVAGASALPALSQGIVSLTVAMTDLSRVSLALPGLLAGVGAAAGSLLTGLNGISTAFKASNDGMQKSSQYARQYAQASRELQNAQRDVVKALKDANRELEDQKDKLATGQLSVDRAQLNLRRANERMFQGGFKSITDYQEALLDVKQAHLDLSQAVKQNGRDIQDYYANASRGATGSNTFRDSLDKLSNSIDAFHKAQFQAAGMSEQFISAMNRLSPAGQDFVLQVLKMRGAWLGLQSSVQTTLFKGLGDAITDLANRQMPMLKTGMQQVAASINADFKSLFAAIGRDANTANIANIFKNTATGLKAAAPGLDSFTSGLLKLSEVGTRFLPRMALAFDKVMARFEAFINRADQDGSLNRWIDSGLKLVASLGRSLLDIGKILNSITEAYNKATGNVGGFASTMERGLAKLSSWLASPSGQTSIITWMRTSREFMHQIGQTLPGIRNIFATVGDGARMFAENMFPVFSLIGNLLNKFGNFGKDIVFLTIAFRASKPVVAEITKVWTGLNAAIQKYNEANKARIEMRNNAWKDAFNADGLKFAAQQRLKALQDEVKETDALYTRMFNSRVAGLRDLARAERESEAAKAKAKASKKAANKDGLDPIAAKAAIATYKADAQAYKNAKQVEAEALADFNLRDERLTNAAVNRTRIRRELEINGGKAYKDLRVATDLAAKAQENLGRVTALTADGMTGKWRRATSSIKNWFGDLRGAMGLVLGGITGIGASIGLAAGFDLLTAAQDRNRASADNLKQSQDALAQTLSNSTGSATAATLEENVRQLQDRANPVHPDDKGQNFNAAKILEQQLGIKLPEAANLALPTQVKQREARLAPADAQIIAAVPGLDEWKKWGKEYERNGVNTSVYGKALNGDPESIGKVEAARLAIKNSHTPGLNLGTAVKALTAPNDLGHAQEQLDRSGPTGGLRGLSLAVGAERSIGNESLAAGQKAFEASNAIQQNGLNAKGMRAFGPFTLGAHGAVIRPDGSAVIEVDKYPDDVVKGWIQGATGNGISVERRYPGGAVITIDAEHGRQYFNGYAAGGSVWGAGTATSDSIPAMLSNGEFVINAKSAALIGHERLHQMNSMKFANGGLVRGFGTGGSPDDGNSGSILGNAWDWFKNLFSPDPVGMVPGDSRRPDAAENGWGPVPINPLPAPPTRTDEVDSSPVTLPYNPPAPPPVNPGKGIGGNIGNTGTIYTPMWGGSGALPDFGTTGASAVKNAPINPDANILDYLQQMANAYGLLPGAGPGAGGLPLKGQDPVAFGRASEIASQFGIQTHPNDGMEHSVDRALDIGTAQQSQNGSITKFVEDWMADPQKVAATRQLIYKDPKTGKVYGIINGHATDANVTYGDIDRSTGRRTIDEHDDHVHLALEGVPLNAFPQSGGAAPTGTGMTLPPPPSISTPPITAITPGPAADVSTPNAPQTPGVIKGPFGDIPFDPIYILKQIGAAILKGVFAFFGVDGSGFVDALFALGDKKPPGPNVAEIPQPDQKVIDSLDQQIAQYDKMGPAGKQMADQLRAGKADYLKPFEAANSTQSANSAADYFDSIGDHATADKLRKASNPNPERFSPVTTVPGTGSGPTVLPRPVSGSPGGIVAPSANYSGGTPEVHNAVYRAFKEAGYPDSEWPSLVTLLNHENNTWDPTRPTGGPDSDARGIFQFLSTTWGTVGMQPSDDPYQQGVAGMKYIKQRYQTPTGAWTAWQNQIDKYGHNWYARGGPVRKFSGGGKVRGPGTGTSDSIPAMLSAGEFVMRADAVDHWGEDKLHAMNRYSGGGLATAGYSWIDLVDDMNKRNPDGTRQDLWGKVGPKTLDGTDSWVGASPNPNKQGYLDNLPGFSGGGSVGAPAPIDPVWIAAFLGQGALQTGLWAANMRNALNDPKDKKANGGLIRRYAPGGMVSPIDPTLISAEQQKQMLRSAFMPTGAVAPTLGGGGDFNSAPPAQLNLLGGAAQVSVPKWLSGASRWVGENVQAEKWIDWADSKTGGTDKKDGFVWNAINQGLGMINPAFGFVDSVKGGKDTSGRQLAQMFAIPDLVKDAVTMSDPNGGVIDRLGAFAELGATVAPGAGKGIGKGIEAVDAAVLRGKYLKGIDFELDGLSRGTKLEVKNTVAELRKAYGTAPLSKVAATDFGKEGEHAWASAIEYDGNTPTDNPSLNSIQLNKDFFSDRKKLNKSYGASVGRGWAVGGPRGNADNIRAILAHEYGHIMDFHFGKNFLESDIEGILRQRFDPERDGRIMWNGDASMDYPDEFTSYIRSIFPHGYSYSKDAGNAAEVRNKTQRIIELQRLGYMDGPAEALKSIDRHELIANSFAEVFLHGNNASLGSKYIYEEFRNAGEQFDKYNVSGQLANGRPLRPLPKILPTNPDRSSKIWDTPKSIPGRIRQSAGERYGVPERDRSGPEWREYWAQRPGIGMPPPYPIELSMRGRADLNPDSAASVVESIYPFSVEEGGWNGYLSSRRDGVPDDSPFNANELNALQEYSESSQVNKILRGSYDLPTRTNVLKDLLSIRPEMEGFGGRMTSIQSQELLKFLAQQTKAGVSAKDAIEGALANPGLNRPGRSQSLSSQKVWENWFMSHLAASRLKASSTQAKIKQAEYINSAFSKVKPLDQSLWVTRMIEDFGHGVDVSDPESLIGQLLPPNPGFSSTSVGIVENGMSGRNAGITQRRGRGGYGLDWRFNGNPYPERNIMQQIRVPRGTPAVWFGGHEKELLLPPGLQYQPWGHQDIMDAAEFGPDDRRIFEEAAKLYESKMIAGGASPRKQTKFWGGAQFDGGASFDAAIDDIGLKDMIDLLRPLGWNRLGEGNPGWMDLMAPESLNSVLPPWSEFRDVPPLHELGFATGGPIHGPGGPRSDSVPAMLSNGEFVMNAAATKRIGIDRLMAMNHYADGGPVSPTGSADPDAFKDLRAIMSKPLITPAATGSSDPDAFKNLDSAGNTVGNAVGSVLAPKGGASGMSASAPAPRAKDPRAILGRAPTSDEHTNPALSSGIRGAFNTIGAIAAQAAAAGGSIASMGATGGAPVPGAGQAASALVSEGFQIAGDVAAGAANIVSSFLVGTVTPSETGQGYGAPLLPQQPQGGGMNNFQSIHNGNIVTNNLSEYSRLKDRKDAQKAAPFFNRVNH